LALFEQAFLPASKDCPLFSQTPEAFAKTIGSRMKIKILHKKQMKLNEVVANMVLYHGTSVRNVPAILQKGLEARSGAVWGGGTPLKPGEKAIFITRDFEKAARYGLSVLRNEVPAIIELVLSKPRRFNKVFYDPMDRAEHHSDESETDEIVYNIERILENIAESFGYEGNLRLPKILEPDELEELNKVNIFKESSKFLVKLLNFGAHHKFEIRKLIKKVVQAFRNVNWEMLEVRPDGTMKLTQEFFDSREQLLYKKSMPSKSIKGIWVRAEDFLEHKDLAIDSKKAGIRDLPGEDEDYKEFLLSLQHLDPSELSDEIEMAKTYDPELVELLKAFESGEINEQEFREELFGFEDDLFSTYGERISPAILWLKFAPKDFIQMQSPNKYLS